MGIDCSQTLWGCQTAVKNYWKCDKNRWKDCDQSQEIMIRNDTNLSLRNHQESSDHISHALITPNYQQRPKPSISNLTQSPSTP